MYNLNVLVVRTDGRPSGGQHRNHSYGFVHNTKEALAFKYKIGAG